MTEPDRKIHTDLFLIRHGETDSNAHGILHGITDVPLNALGQRQAELIARRMSTLPYLDRIISSPLQRAYRTAEAIAKLTGIPHSVHNGLVEMNFGVAEGIQFEQLGGLYPDESARFLDPSNLDARYEKGESRGEFFARVERTIDEIATQYLGEDIVVVAHGGFISAVMAVTMQEHPNNWSDHPIRNTSLTHIEFATDGPIAHLVNDVIHLDQVELAEDAAGDQ